MVATPRTVPGLVSDTRGADSSVTVIVSRKVRPGAESAFEEWVAGICEAAARFPGHMGATLQRPDDVGRDPYVLVFRFDRYEHLVAWNGSAARAEWVERARPFTVEDPHLEVITGLEHWFTPPPGRPALPPPRGKMALVTWLAIYPLAVLLPIVLAPVLGPLPPIVRVGVTTFTMVILMTYLVMPRVTRALSRWLFGR